LAIFAAWTALKLGPSGEALFSVSAKAPGVLVVGPDVLNSVDVPVRVTATRSDGRVVRVVAAPSGDARAVLGPSLAATVTGVHFPAGTLDLRTSGTGAPRDLNTADVWRLTSTGTGSAGMVVDQVGGPETVVVTSGDATALGDVTLTLTWADRTWFFEALAVAVIGGIISAFALGGLRAAFAQPDSSPQSGRRHGGVTS